MTINRRETGAALFAAGLAVGVPAAAASRDASPSLEFVFEALVTLAPPVELGTINGARRRLVPITGGTVSGPRLKGVVLPGGGDWQSIGPDGVTQIHARYSLRSADGTPISVDNPGVRVASPEVIARLTAGEDVDPDAYYFRTTPSFEVEAGGYDWLRRSVFVAKGIRRPDHVVIRFFRVT